MKIADTSSQDERLAPKKTTKKNLGSRLNQPASGIAAMADYSGSA